MHRFVCEICEIHLEYSRFTNIRLRLRTYSYAYTRVVIWVELFFFFEKSECVFKSESFTHILVNEIQCVYIHWPVSVLQ